MNYLNNLVSTHWTTEYMMDKKQTAQLLVDFNQNNFLSKIKLEFIKKKKNNKQNLNQMFKDLYVLSSFANDIENERLSLTDKKIINSLKETIDSINNKYNNSFEKYITSIKTHNIDNDIGVRGIQKAKGYLSKHRQINHLDSSIKDLVSSMSSLKYRRKNKLYNSGLKEIKDEYKNIQSMIADLKEEEYICDQDIDDLAEKEQDLNSNMEDLIAQTSKKPKNKILRVIGGSIAAIAMLLSMLEIGEFSYEHKSQIKDFFLINKSKVTEIYNSIEKKVDNILRSKNISSNEGDLEILSREEYNIIKKYI